MKRIRFLGMMLLSVFLGVGCSEAYESDAPPQDNGDAIVFNISIGQDMQTRVATGVDLKSTFDTGDQIGIFAVKRKIGESA